MLVERSRAEAVTAFLSGRKVTVLTEFSDGSIAAEPIEAILSEEDTHYLVDVPAVEDPEFRQAVEDMIHEPDQDAVDEKDPMEGEVPPPSRGRRRKSLRPENKKGVSPGAVC